MPELDLQGILEQLEQAGVEYIVIGGVAVGFHGRFDVMQWIGDTELWGMLSPASVEVEMEGLSVRVAGYEDLVALKRLAARPSDLEDLNRLRQARGE